MAEEIHAAIQDQDLRKVSLHFQRLRGKKNRIRKLTRVFSGLFQIELVEAINGAFEENDAAFLLEMLGEEVETPSLRQEPESEEDFGRLATDLQAALNAENIDRAAIFALLLSLQGNQEHATEVVDAYGRPDADNLTGDGLEADLMSRLQGDDVNFALYLLFHPGEDKRIYDHGIEDKGEEQDRSAVPGGEMSVHTGVDIAPERQDGFSVGYEGALSEYTHILQFGQRTLIGVDSDNVHHYMEAEIETSGGSFDLIGPNGPGLDNIHVDYPGEGKPWYDAGGQSQRDNDLVEIYDDPDWAPFWITGTFDQVQAERVITHIDFFTYLVRDYQPLRRAHIRVSATYNSRGDHPDGTATLVDIDDVAALDPMHKAKLVEEFPNYKYIK